MKKIRAEFLQSVLSPKRLTRVVDIGANPLGAPPYSTLLSYGFCDVWGFEPQESAYQVLEANKGSHETYLPYAVGGGGKEYLYICKESGFTSLFQPNQDFIRLMGRWPEGMHVEEVIPIETRRLDDIEEIPEFDLLKIDVQGSETVVFENAVSKLENAVGVISEVAMVPLYEGQPLLDSQMSALSSQGFAFHKFLFLKSFRVDSPSIQRLRPRRHKNQVIDGDAVFLKSLLKLENYSTEGLKHLTILADAVLESFDVAVLALDWLAKHDVVSDEQIHKYLDMLPPETTFTPIK